MTKIFTKAVLPTTLAATALTAASPAMADQHRGGYNRDRGDSTGAATGTIAATIRVTADIMAAKATTATGIIVQATEFGAGRPSW